MVYKIVSKHRFYVPRTFIYFCDVHYFLKKVTTPKRKVYHKLHVSQIEILQYFSSKDKWIMNTWNSLTVISIHIKYFKKRKNIFEGGTKYQPNTWLQDISASW